MSYDKDGITYNGLGEPLPWEEEKVPNTELEEKLKRLRKLWVFAKSQGKEAWAKQIEIDANWLKETPPDDYEVMKGLVESSERS